MVAPCGSTRLFRIPTLTTRYIFRMTQHPCLKPHHRYNASSLSPQVGVYAHEHEDLQTDNFMKVYSPTQGDECYITLDSDGNIDAVEGCVDPETIAWWHMNCGRVLGVYDGRLIEYDPSTLAPLGLVVGQDELAGKRVVVVSSSGEENCAVSQDVGLEGADCAVAVDEGAGEQAVLLVDDHDSSVTVIQPNEDGSYWRKIVRNKVNKHQRTPWQTWQSSYRLQLRSPGLNTTLPRALSRLCG
mmetsp:Transcript_68322/g.189831  ORF Transcript_68322/g.189831 Transcript_68322/m.189831 type:complete len:242 (-) Transcript_68322:204-929(-)